jgi:recombinational DNA repair protein RecT
MSQELIRKQIEAPATLDRFTKIFGAIQKVDSSAAQQMFEVEKFHFIKELSERGIQDVTPVSAMGTFLDVVSNGLSFASGAKHVYLMTRSVKSGRKDGNNKDIYEKRLVFSTSPDGKIFQAQRSGAIDYVTKPVIVYEGDDFAVSTNADGEQIIRHQVKFPRSSQKIVAGYVYVVMKNGKREPYWMDLNDIQRLAGYSAKQNSRWDEGLKKKVSGEPNALYTAGQGGQIDPGFFGAKLINFALKNVRKSAIASQYEVNGDAGDAAIITGATEIAAQDDSQSFEPAYVVEPEQPAQPAQVAQPITSPAAAAMPHVTKEPF